MRRVRDLCFFFFQAEDGIRDIGVTGVQRVLFRSRVVIHVTQGSWSGAVNWFQNPNAGVSAHYTVRSSDGKIAQSVSDTNIAYHAGQWPYNVHSIGIEHEGFVSDPKWFTPEMYRSSARLLAYLCRWYR